MARIAALVSARPWVLSMGTRIDGPDNAHIARHEKNGCRPAREHDHRASGNRQVIENEDPEIRRSLDLLAVERHPVSNVPVVRMSDGRAAGLVVDLAAVRVDQNCGTAGQVQTRELILIEPKGSRVHVARFQAGSTGLITTKEAASHGQPRVILAQTRLIAVAGKRIFLTHELGVHRTVYAGIDVRIDPLLVSVGPIEPGVLVDMDHIRQVPVTIVAHRCSRVEATARRSHKTHDDEGFHDTHTRTISHRVKS